MSNTTKTKTARNLVAVAQRHPKAPLVDYTILEKKIGYQLRMADRMMSRDFVKNVGVTQAQYSVLSLVATNENLSQMDIGEALELDRSSTMALVDKLEASGLIERCVSNVDKRMHALRLTAVGRKQFPEINRQVVEHEDRFQSKLTATEQATFLKCLWKMRRG